MKFLNLTLFMSIVLFFAGLLIISRGNSILQVVTGVLMMCTGIMSFMGLSFKHVLFQNLKFRRK